MESNKDKSVLIRDTLPSGYIILLSHLLFIPLLILSVIYYKERLFGDSAWYLFRVVNSENFVIEHLRPSLYLWQWFIILLTKARVPMTIILYGYSIFHVLFFYLAFVFVTHVLKDFRSGIFILCFQLLGVSDMFFFVPMWEMWYGLVIAAIQLALWRKGKNNLVIDLCLTLYIFMSYPFNIIVWVAAILLVFPIQFLQKNVVKLSSLFILCLFIKLSSGNQYESQKMTQIFAVGLADRIRLVFNLKYLSVFLDFYFHRYTLVSICVVLSVWILKADKLKCFLFISMVIGSILSINIAFDANEFGSYGSTFEAIYYIIPTLCLLAIIYNNNGWQSSKDQIMWGLSLVILTYSSIHNIIDVSDIYQERTLLIDRSITKGRQRSRSKIFYNDENIKRFNYHYCMFSIPMESLLLSACEGSKKCVSVAEMHMLDSLSSWTILSPDKYVMMNNMMPNISSLNMKYFQLHNEPYTSLNEDNCLLAYNYLDFINGVAKKDHNFTTDGIQHYVFHVFSNLSQPIKICSRDTSLYWIVETVTPSGGKIPHDRQPLSNDMLYSLDDYLIIRSDSISPDFENTICLIKNNRPIAKFKIE